MIRVIPLAVMVLLLIFLAGCTPLAPGMDPALSSEFAAAEPVALGVGFIPNVQFTPYYVGIAKGFYADEGIDLTLDYGFENDYLKLVAADELQFLIASGDQVVLGRSQGLPVRYVMNWYTLYPVVIFAKAESGIVRPSDLAGKTIGIPGPFGANYVALRGILEAAGLSEADVQLESIGFTQAAAVLEDRVDAAVDYGVNGPVILAQAGVATHQIPLDRYLRIPANGLVTNERTLAQEPDLVQAMVRATLRSIEYTLANPDEAFAIALTFVPEAGGENEAANRAVFDAVLPYWTPQSGKSPGVTQQEEWQAAVDLLTRIGLVSAPPPAGELFTNRFVGE